MALVVKNLPAMQDTQGFVFNPWVGKMPRSRKWHPIPVFLPGKFHGQSSLADYSPWGHKELDTMEQLSARARTRTHTHTHTHTHTLSPGHTTPAPPAF